MSSTIKHEGKFAGKKLTLEKGHLAYQATSSVRAQYGDTVVLAAVTASNNQRDGVDYLPLMVDYEEKMYASGKIKGSRFIKREGRPTDEAVLTSRLIDRSLRPLFDPKIRNDLQVIVSVLSLDPEADPRMTAAVAASAALATSGIPTLYGPIGVARIAEKDGELVMNPGHDVAAEATTDLLVTGTEETVNMIEARGLDVPEDRMHELILKAHAEIKNCAKIIQEFTKKCGETSAVEMIYTEDLISDEVKAKIKDYVEPLLDQALFQEEKLDRNRGLEELLKKVVQEFDETDGSLKSMINSYFHSLVEKRARQVMVEDEKRVDGRRLNALRSLEVQVGALPRTHGAAIFGRGLTQAISVVTLGGPGDALILDTMEEDTSRSYFHHYNFPPFCVGEVAPMRGPSRRDIGHGALAEKAIVPYLPEKEEFPYTIRVVTEILSSNGSSSMAAVCGSSLSLMDAGVPIKKACAGIAMGIVFSEDKKQYKVLTDIQGIEDHAGDMDFKVAGTADGISALQMDVKMEGLPLDLFPELLKQAKAARLEILAQMNREISAPRKDLSPHAPRIVTLEINPDKIRDVIGPGGKVINAIIAETGVDIDIEDSGLVIITSVDKEASEKAVEWVKNLTREVKVGESFDGKITRLMELGAFAEVLPGQEGLIHISEIAPFHVDRVENYLKVGQVVPVKVIEIDDSGRINLSCKNLLKLKPRNDTPQDPRKPKGFSKFKKRKSFR